MKYRVLVLSLLLVALSCTPVRADAIAYPATDTFISQLYPTVNFAYNDAVSVGEWNGAEGDVRRGIIRFDLSGIPAEAQITKATFTLTIMQDFSDNAGYMYVYPLTEAFVGTEVTWENMPSYDVVNIGAVYLADNLLPLSTVTIALSTQALRGAAFGLMLKTENELNDLYKFYSLSNTDYKPRLTVEYFIPEEVTYGQHNYAKIGQSQLNIEKELFDTTFINAMQVKHPDWQISLIQCAVGGTTIHQWQRSTDPNSLYGACMEKINQAKAFGTLEGILFFQGESDAKNLYDASHWRENFLQLVSDLNSDFGNIPFVFAQIGEICNPDFPYVSIVQAAQFDADFITSDLPHDCYHLSAQGGIDVAAERFAEAMP